MKIEITLKNPKYCEGCPCKNSDYEYGASCNLGYWDKETEILIWLNKKTGKRQKESPFKNNIKGWVYNEWDLITVRPQKCIDENGL